MYQKLSLYTCLVGIFILIINALANIFYWYTAIYGFDKGVHFLGGIFLALLGGALFLKTILPLETMRILIILILFTFIVGLLWEFYEYLIQGWIKSVRIASLPDSIGDLFFDMMGGIVGTYFVIRTKRRYNKANGI